MPHGSGTQQRGRARKSRLEVAAEAILAEYSRTHIPLKWEPQFKFHPVRQWRADFLVGPRADPHWPGPQNTILVEVEGITRYGGHLGRHQSAKGYEADCRKYVAATLLGYTVFRFTENMIADGTMEEVLRARFDS